MKLADVHFQHRAFVFPHLVVVVVSVVVVVVSVVVVMASTTSRARREWPDCWPIVAGGSSLPPSTLQGPFLPPKAAKGALGCPRAPSSFRCSSFAVPGHAAWQ